MEFKKKKLSNGLSIIGEVNKSAQSAGVGFYVKTGARDETMEVNGVSHFLEHMVFKGTEKLTSAQVNEAFDRTGAQFNAFTSEEMTVFYAAVLPEYLSVVTELWIGLMRPILRDEDFNIEKNVIKEEIAMYKDMPSYEVMDNCRKLHFGGHRCGQSVLGSNESIDGLSSGQMRGYFEQRYCPNNMVLCFTGNFDWEEICRIAEKGCSGWVRKEGKRELSDWGGTKKAERLSIGNMSMEHICLMSRGVSAQDPRRFAAYLLAVIAGDDMGSRYFWGLVDKAIAETASMGCGLMDGTGIFYSYIHCERGNAEKAVEIVKKILEELERNGVTEEELRAAKNKTLSAMVLKNELPTGRLIDVGSNWLYLEKYLGIEEEVNSIKTVRVEDINKLIKEFHPGEFTRFSIGPDKQQA